MSEDLAVVMDAAGTILRMYRVAKDIIRGIMLEKVITWELIMEKEGRALVVPQIDPTTVISLPPEDHMASIIKGRERLVEISCSSSPITKEDALKILMALKSKFARCMRFIKL